MIHPRPRIIQLVATETGVYALDADGVAWSAHKGLVEVEPNHFEEMTAWYRLGEFVDAPFRGDVVRLPR